MLFLGGVVCTGTTSTVVVVLVVPWFVTTSVVVVVVDAPAVDAPVVDVPAVDAPGRAGRRAVVLGRSRLARDDSGARREDVVACASVDPQVGRQVVDRLLVARDRIGLVDRPVVPVVQEQLPARRGDAGPGDGAVRCDGCDRDRQRTREALHERRACGRDS